MAPQQPPFLALSRRLDAPLPVLVWPSGFSRAPLSAALAPALHALLQRAYANGGGSVVPDWLDWWEWLAGDAEFDPALCFIAMADAAPAGFCLCWSSGFVKDLVVDAPHRQRGLGATLLAEALQAFRARGLATARLKVEAGNHAARRLYARMGFS